MAVILGTTGSDVRNGTSANDAIFGWAPSGNANTPSGNDTLIGGGGNDQLEGGTGLDSLLGGAGIDTLFGHSGSDTLRGGDGNDSLFGQQDSDSLFGDAGNDRLVGEDGNDTLNGGLGRDTLLGGIGNDILIGGDGNDRLVGSAGDDRLTGNAGADTFVFSSLSEGIDTITDFFFAQGDKIEASASGFGIAVGDTSRFTFDSSNRILFFDTTALAILQPSSAFIPSLDINVV